MKEHATSIIFAIMAIENVSKNAGHKTSGIDNKVLKTEEDKMNLVKELTFKELKNYKASPVRRVYIYDPIKDKQRPLGIPTIKDRCVQEIFRLVLDPAIDTLSDPDSYGFRPFRNCHMALGRVQKTLIKNTARKTVIDADIKGFFNNINHEWIIKNFPFPLNCEHILKEWLKAGILEKGQLEFNDIGVPQGGIISPLIGNYTLNGIEKAAFNGLRKYRPGTKNKEHHTDLTRTLIRYADDFVVIIGDVKEEYTNLVMKNIVEFLKERGLSLNETKTKILYFGKENEKGEIIPMGNKFQFLGFIFHFIPNPKISSFFNRKDLLEDAKLFVYPDRVKFINFKNKIKTVISESKNLTAYELIKKLNPLITGWTNYYGLSICAKTLAHLDNYIYRRLWVWLIKKHPKISKVYLADKYFKNQEVLSPNKRQWHFFGRLEKPSINIQKRRKSIIFLKLASKINNIIAIFKLALSPELRITTPYIHKDKFIEFSVKTNKLRMVKEGYSNTSILYNIQEGYCEYCNKPLLEDGDLSNTEIHHITPLNIGGSETTLSNKSLIHKNCHVLLHKKYGKKNKTILPFRVERSKIKKTTNTVSYYTD
jgi:RNA-directed DNA polymerase